MMASFDSIYEEHYGRLFTLAFRMTGNKEDAEDVLQNAFINAYKAFADFKHKSSFYTWLYRIVVNEAKRYLTYIQKMPVDSYADEQNISPQRIFERINGFGEVEDEVMTRSARETCLQLFMNCMAPKYRVVFTLRLILQFSVRDTADILELSENSVKVNLHRARILIKELMEGRCSLINPNNPCKCGSWVKYAIDCNRQVIIKDITVIQYNENRVAEEFKKEAEELLTICQLYNTQIVPNSYELFKAKVKELIKERRLKLLEVD